MNGLLESVVIPLCIGLLLLSVALWAFQAAMG